MSATGFSYAQAARGQAVSPQRTTATANSTSHSLVGPVENDSFDSTAISEPDFVLGLPTTSDADKPAFSESGPGSRKIESDAGSATDSATLIGTLVESTSNLSLDDLPANFKSSQISALGNYFPSADNSTRTGKKAKTTKMIDRDGEVSTTKVTEKEKAIEAILSPAPVPAKNIWDERRRELAAKSGLRNTIVVSNLDASTTTAFAMGVINSSANPVELKKNQALSADLETATESTSLQSITKSQPRRLSETSHTEQARRNGSRGNRGVDKDTKNAIGRLVQDTTLWPTPESAAIVEDLKVKALSEKTDKAESGAKDTQEEGTLPKSRRKGAWVTLDFVPTVNFQTPIPNVRGSRPKTGARGGRETSSRGGYNGATAGPGLSDKLHSASTSPIEKAALETREKSRELNGSTSTARSHNLPSNPPKRFSADSIQNRDTRKSPTSADPDRLKNSASENPGVPWKVDFAPKDGPSGGVNGGISNYHSPAYPAQPDRRTAAPKGGDHVPSSKENGTQQNQGVGTRERAEMKSERSGRSGFRGGRGGHGSSASQGQHISRSYQSTGQRGTLIYNSVGSALPPVADPFDLTMPQYSFGHAPNASRPGRTPNRPQSASQASTFVSRSQNGIVNSSRTNANTVQSPGLPTDFHLPQQYPVLTFPIMDNDHFQALVRQLEYYFSLENLCKDMFLRKKMDGQGFVPLLVVAGFRRMAELAPSVDFIRTACEQSEKLDYVIDKDQNELIRSRFEWKKFILPTEQRMEEARGSGPDMRAVHHRSFHSRLQQPYFSTAFASGYQPAVQSVFSSQNFPSVSELAYQAYENGTPVDHAYPVNGNAETNEELHAGESKLSAMVPDFSPSNFGGAPMTLEDYQNCPDEQVEKLVVIVASDADELVTDTPESGDKTVVPNGSHSSTVNPSSSIVDASFGAFRGQFGDGDTPAARTAGASWREIVSEEPYPDLRARSFNQRSSSRPGENLIGMKHLYRFWSHCLRDKFNVRMYEDFRTSALEDARGEPSNDFGLQSLLRYYSHVLIDPAGSKPYPSVFVPHFVEAKELAESRKSNCDQT